MIAATQRPFPALTIFTARRIHTMDESLPVATAVAVADGRIVAVGSLDDMAPWREGRSVTVDERFAKQVLLPGLIDNHIHPFLGALLMPTEHIAPEPWRQADGTMRPAAPAPETAILTWSIRLPTNSSPLSSAAVEMMAVPCWSSWNTGMFMRSRSFFSM